MTKLTEKINKHQKRIIERWDFENEVTKTLGKFEALEEQIGMPLDVLVNKVIEIENTFETSFDEVVEWLYKNTPVVD